MVFAAVVLRVPGLRLARLIAAFTDKVNNYFLLLARDDTDVQGADIRRRSSAFCQRVEDNAFHLVFVRPHSCN